VAELRHRALVTGLNALTCVDPGTMSDDPAFPTNRLQQV